MITAIVLAAGKSQRIGRPKPNLPLGNGETFLMRVVRTFIDAQVEEVVVVVGHDSDVVVANFAASGLPARFVDNPDYERGQLSSLVAGLRVVDRPGVVATLVTLVDIPLVMPATVRAVVDRYRQIQAPIVRPVRDGRHGHPVLIDRALFTAIRRAGPEGTAKSIVRAHASIEGDVEVCDEGAFTDIDTEADYERIIAGKG